MGTAEQQQERLAKERAEIAARVASFKATQQKFERERDEYFVATLRNACATGPLPFWS
jgi:chorismate mutase